ncbi:MAG TPA: LLM class flavin-dependent oxidoreductase [Candidatus Dietzia intestinigallinarum]|nr:LLM class flavin-dependent oxidoreductase [Candidatus Dietzia intestinigallinarum]
MSGEDGPAAAYERAIRLAQAAESAGYGSFWVAQHRFGAQRAHLPAPLVLLAAVARETSSIELGTASIAAALEDPKRLAEDAAVVDALSGGRLQLGLGSGSEPVASAAWGFDHDARYERFWSVADELCSVLAGGPFGRLGDVAANADSPGVLTPGHPSPVDRDGRVGVTAPLLHPPAGGLGQRIWVTAASSDTASNAARRGLGLIVGRRRVGDGGVRAEDGRVAGVIDDYRASGGARVAVSRPVVASSDASIVEMVRGEERRLRGPGSTLTIATGPAGELLEAFSADPGIRRADRILLHTRPIDVPLEAEIESIHALALACLKG